MTRSKVRRSAVPGPESPAASASSWRQPLPAAASEQRTVLIGEVARRVTVLGSGRLRVAIDGMTTAGKTSFGHELAAAIRKRGRPTLRASLDDFKNPWREARELGYDRESGPGYYRNAYDFTSARELLLGPAGPDGSGNVVRGIARDAAMEGSLDAAARLHRDRYHAAELLYISEVGPVAQADVVIDNNDFARPWVVGVSLSDY